MDIVIDYFIIGWLFGALLLICQFCNDKHFKELDNIIITSILYWPLIIIATLWYCVSLIKKHKT